MPHINPALKNLVEKDFIKSYWVIFIKTVIFRDIENSKSCKIYVSIKIRGLISERDDPGMNTVIRAVVTVANHYHYVQTLWGSGHQDLI